ncbi:MAG: hypothetical protein LBI17_04160, partial [Rickettsiales bacterium]|nr:hypothetical protein [Rickettsiales bacterium]
MKHVFDIPASRPFLRSLCAYSALSAEGEGVHVADDVILLPTRRACRALREEFAAASTDGVAVLPSIRPLGDVDEDGFAFIDYENPDAEDELLPAIPPVERSLVLAALIRRGSPAMPEGQSYELASDLARLIDTVQMEELGFDALDRLVPERYSEYWRQTLEFLGIVTEFYPKILAERGYMDPVARKVALMKMQVEMWRASPPKGRIIAAGSTGSLVPVAKMLAAIAGMENGCVVLPALDRFMTEPDFQSVGQNHPQYGLKNLLARMGLKRSDVADLPEKHAIQPAFGIDSNCRPPQPFGHRGPKAEGDDTALFSAAKSRELLASQIMLDSTAGADWRSMPEAAPDVMEGVSRLDLRNEAEEVLAVSVVLRDSIERGLRVHLVTPSRKIAKSVASALRRWGLEIDDSAGRPASETATGSYFILAMRAVAEDFAPYPLLALLRHSFTRIGYPKAELEELVGRFEKYVLRGASSGGGLAGLAGRIAGLKSERPDRDFSDFDGLLRRLESASRELRSYLSSDKKYPLAELLRAHIAFVEGLVRNDGKEPDFTAKILYSDDTASQVADELRGLLSELEAIKGDDMEIDLIKAGSYPEFIASRM